MNQKLPMPNAEAVESDSDWMAPYRAPGFRGCINVGVMNSQQRAELMERGLPAGITNMAKIVEIGVQTSKEQAKRASKPRRDGQLEDIERRLAKRDETAKELWLALIGELDDAGCDPREHATGDDIRKWRINYTDANGKPRRVTFDTFQRHLGRIRKPE